MDYFLWNTAGDVNDEDICFIEDSPEGMGLEVSYLQLGLRAVKYYPDDARIKLRKENPGLALPGFVGNTENLIILNSAGRAVIDEYCAGDKIEIFPFTLINQKDRVHSDDYVIVNPLEIINALDMKGSDLTVEDNGEVEHIKKFVLKSSKLKNVPHLFRLGEQPANYIFSRELGRALNTARISNILGKQIRQT